MTLNLFSYIATLLIISGVLIWSLRQIVFDLYHGIPDQRTWTTAGILILALFAIYYLRVGPVA